MIPGNIPTIQLKDLTPEEELFYFASERDLYISGLQVIVNCSRLAENNFEDNHMYGPFIAMVLLDEVTLSHHLRTERYAILPVYALLLLYNRRSSFSWHVVLIKAIFIREIIVLFLHQYGHCKVKEL